MEDDGDCEWERETAAAAERAGGIEAKNKERECGTGKRGAGSGDTTRAAKIARDRDRLPEMTR